MLEGLFQPLHLLIIAGIALLVFGPKKLPELGKGLGDGIRGFKTAMNGSAASDPETPTENGKSEGVTKAS
jgi:sec-independent protein translocase protein TatA